ENAAKAALATLGPVGRTHNPAAILQIALDEDRFPPELKEHVGRLTECARQLGPAVHIRSDCGDENTRQTPWELFDEPAARQALALAGEAVSLARGIAGVAGDAAPSPGSRRRKAPIPHTYRAETLFTGTTLITPSKAKLTARPSAVQRRSRGVSPWTSWCIPGARRQMSRSRPSSRGASPSGPVTQRLFSPGSPFVTPRSNISQASCVPSGERAISLTVPGCGSRKERERAVLLGPDSGTSWRGI